MIFCLFIILALRGGPILGFEDPAEQLAQAKKMVDMEDNIQAERLATRALTELRAQNAQQSTIAEALEILSRSLNGQGRLIESERIIRTAIQVRHEHTPQDLIAVAKDLISLSAITLAGGRYDEAEKSAIEAIAILSKAKDRKSDICSCYDILSNVYIFRKQYEKAEKNNSDGLSIRRSSFGESSPEISKSYDIFALIKLSENQFDESMKYAKSSLQLRENGLGKNHLSVASSLDILVAASIAKNDYIQANASAQRALDIRQKKYGINDPKLDKSWENLFKLQFRFHHFDEAELRAKSWLKYRETVFGENSPKVAEVLEDYAVVLDKLGRPLEADDLQDRAINIKGN